VGAHVLGAVAVRHEPLGFPPRHCPRGRGQGV
jgi:hypothetical protein